MGSRSSGSFPSVLAEWASLGKAGWHFRGAQVPFFLFGFLLFRIIFLLMVQEAILALRELHILNTCINCLGKKLALNLFVYNSQCQVHAG